MSFERVHNYIKTRNQTTLVIVVDGRAKCMSADSMRIEKIMRDAEKMGVIIVGFYNSEVNDIHLAEDLLDAGIGV